MIWALVITFLVLIDVAVWGFVWYEINRLSTEEELREIDRWFAQIRRAMADE